MFVIVEVLATELSHGTDWKHSQNQDGWGRRCGLSKCSDDCVSTNSLRTRSFIFFMSKNISGPSESTSGDCFSKILVSVYIEGLWTWLSEGPFMYLHVHGIGVYIKGLWTWLPEFPLVWICILGLLALSERIQVPVRVPV